MKKNKMMRTAAVLGVATLLTTCALSGTLAKYTTTASGGDTARVAKWNITMGNNGSGTFTDTYDSIENTTVKGVGDNGTDVVAPGTHGSATYYVDGAPETAYEVTFNGEKKNDVFLANGLQFKYEATKDNATNASYSAPGKDTETTITSAYYPVNYSVEIKRNNTSTSPTIESNSTTDSSSYIKEFNKPQTFETLDAAMKALSNTKITYSTPNTEAGLTVEFKWAWAFNEENESGENVITVTGHTASDAYDTVLGDISAQNKDLTVVDGERSLSGNTLNAIENNLYDTTIGYTLAITATQID